MLMWAWQKKESKQAQGGSAMQRLMEQPGRKRNIRWRGMLKRIEYAVYQTTFFQNPQDKHKN